MIRILIAGLVGLVTISLYLIAFLTLTHRGTTQGLFQWDASNFLGPRAFAEGLPAAFFGAACDVVVALGWAFGIALVLNRWPRLASRPTLFGIAAGAIVMLTMHFVVVPLGRAALGPPTAAGLLSELLAHTLFFGVPVVWVLTRSGRARPAPR